MYFSTFNIFSFMTFILFFRYTGHVLLNQMHGWHILLPLITVSSAWLNLNIKND